ncbi:polyadenylate-binding protein RBP47B'-like [Vigna umbellata]|uniref:polyadenylate-binding protein RBP47B'-like n=1 Tax=Vigna umbellata TaxID=87088 RepID=UPI001F5FE6A2|nr:polyadenylate-binding protein RBP47B'-like [Vigna umbellata]
MAAAAASQGYRQPSTIEEVRTLWIGDLQYWVDEAYLSHCFAHTGEVLSIKIIRNKMTGQPEGYGFIEFVSHAAAERVLQTYNGMQMPGTEQTFRLNWASFGIGERRPDAGPEYSIFVGDLAPDVTDYLLQETFRAHYHSIRGAKVVTDPNTGRSKGYGFVKFSDENERNRAMTEMNGVYCSTRAMRISAATPKKSTSSYAAEPAPFTKPVFQAPAYTAPVQVQPPEYDVNNTTIFVGNLDPNVSEEELKQNFLQFGEIVSVKIPPGKGCGFVQFRTRASAEEVIQRTQGMMIGQQVVRISWGRTLAARQDLSGGWGQQMDPSQWNTYYGYGQGYETYGYGAAQDPLLYTYGGYQQDPVGGVQDPTGMPAPTMEPREELYDPSTMSDVDKLNDAYLRVHGNSILGRSLWQKTSSSSLPKT